MEAQGREPTVVAVLAGGEGKRIGGRKACVELAGRSLIEYPLAAAAAAGLPAVVVAKHGSELPRLNVPVVGEPADPRHPLCGVVAALRATASPLLVVGCDMPFLTGDLLTRLARTAAGVVLTELDGWIQPLPARCPPEQLPRLEAALARELSLQVAFATLDPTIIGEQELRTLGEPRRLLFSVNDADDLQTAQRWLRDAARR